MKSIINIVLFISLFNSVSIRAQVITDGSMGQIQQLSNHITIPQNLGVTKGDNLFHSFQTFNINSNETVTFTGADNLKNVISRVTGGEASHINGLLQSEIKQANFYFINPAGIFFGKNAQVDVPAAFHISTSDSLNFKDGHRFLASLATTTNNLSIAEPESFGFLNASPHNNALIQLNGAELNFKPEQSIDIVANTIEINNNARIVAPSGEIRLVAMQAPQSVSLIKDVNGALTLPLMTPSITNAGNISLNNNFSSIDNIATIDTSGNKGGHIALWGGKTSLIGSNLYADNLGDINSSPEKGITIHAYSLNLDNSNISFDALGKTDLAKEKIIVESTDFLNIFNKSVIKANTYNDANAASIEISANAIIIDNENSELNNPTGIYSQANITKDLNDNTVKGNSGNVIVNAKTINILNGGVIFTTTSTYGNAGNVILGSDNNLSNLTINSSILHNKTGIFSDANKSSKHGNAGNIDITAKQVNLLNGGSISASTYSKDNAGNINLQADSINIQGFDNLGNIDNGILAVANATYKKTLGHVGNITITANQGIHLYDRGAISVQTDSRLLTDKIGKISIKASDILLDSASIITSQSNATVNASAIELQFSHALTIDNATINTSSSYGNGGDIILNGGKIINLSHQLDENTPQINTSTQYGTKGGDIFGNADILLMNNATIQTQADNANNGGDIALNLKTIVSSQNQLQTNGFAVANSELDMDVLNSIKTAHSGILTLNAPQLNLSGSLGELDYKNAEIPYVSKNNCSDYNYRRSSLLRVSKGNVAITENKLVYIPSAFTKTSKTLHAAINPPLHYVSIQKNSPCAALF